jgi:hypothetical protein
MHLLRLPVWRSSGGSILAYKMVAERQDDKFSTERNSALVVLANARAWASGGWQVTITTADGTEYDPAGFETSLDQTFSKSHRTIHLSVEKG